ncbi:cell division protein FtsQ [Labedella gwakjiensis]|uniref:Cell division protein FtsQ n=1 Tax=Labedella gwakjiensis TaxID=390269 RepID=A0A2P8GZI8_9MICO|nr:FtsQ-type POTRA domain-containing protein [Labedella gwakjiensis]PSL39377.1 cell division protein FtsQ [Labedella gwakjiensis]RUQ86212.1 FtsQ-type POTRA domain-containing protein [Labedella gwakjiensis]
MKRPSGIPRPAASNRPSASEEPETTPDAAGTRTRGLFGRFGRDREDDLDQLTAPIPLPVDGVPAREEPLDGQAASPGDPATSVWRAARARRRREREEVRRFTASSRRRRIVWLSAVGGVLVLAAACVGVSYTPIMAVREVQVEGARLVSSDLIVRDLDSQIGTPLPLVDQSAIKAALVQYPLVQSYSVESRPPSTLVIRIVERRPVGVIAAGDAFDLVDVAGVVLSTSPERPDGYPLMVFDGDSSSEGFSAAASVLRSLPDDVLSTVDEVTATTVDDVTLTLADSGAVVAWGSAEDSAVKAAALEKLMAAYPPESVSRYDVSSPESVVIDPR